MILLTTKMSNILERVIRMVITRERTNGHSHYTLDGEKVSRDELEVRCGKYLSGYGLRSMFNRLCFQGKLIIEVDGAYTYSGQPAMYAGDELVYAQRENAQLKSKLASIRKVANA